MKINYQGDTGHYKFFEGCKVYYLIAKFEFKKYLKPFKLMFVKKQVSKDGLLRDLGKRYANNLNSKSLEQVYHDQQNMLTLLESCGIVYLKIDNKNYKLILTEDKD